MEILLSFHGKIGKEKLAREGIFCEKLIIYSIEKCNN